MSDEMKIAEALRGHLNQLAILMTVADKAGMDCGFQGIQKNQSGEFIVIGFFASKRLIERI